MEWTEEALILGTRRHGESSVILEVMTKERGRHLGLVRGGRSKRLQPSLQPGNRALLTWRARLSDHLGVFTIEPLEMRAAHLMETSIGLYAVQLVASHLRLLPERDPHPGLAEAAEIILSHVDDPPIMAALIIRFELAVLEDLGFGLDLKRCAVTNRSEALAFVSPKSGRAVTEEGAGPYKNKLLALPQFLTGVANEIAGEDLRQGFELSGFFLSRHIFEPRNLAAPHARDTLIRRVLEGMEVTKSP
ncbi:MAG: DNA repair protein RecO [Pseudomonadota bacterium]